MDRALGITVNKRGVEDTLKMSIGYAPCLPPWLERSRAFGLIFNALVASASPSRAALSPRAIGQATMTGVPI